MEIPPNRVGTLPPFSRSCVCEGERDGVQLFVQAPGRRTKWSRALVRTGQRLNGWSGNPRDLQTLEPGEIQNVAEQSRRTFLYGQVHTSSSLICFDPLQKCRITEASSPCDGSASASANRAELWIG